MADTRHIRRCLALICCSMTLAASLTAPARAQQSSVSAWDAADFRIWGYIPYWATTTEINTFDDPGGLYTHVSDVISMAGLQPDEFGDLDWRNSAAETGFNAIRAQATAGAIRLHLCMFEVQNGQTDQTWEDLIESPSRRANFVANVKEFMTGNTGTTADDLKGFNFDWERPSNATEWGNYTQLARELRAAFKDSPNSPSYNWDVSVCDFGSTSSSWDDTALFDAKVYDQLMMMVYHIGATSSASWANTKLALTGQGEAKAFSDDQIGIGVGTYGDGTGSTSPVGISSILAVNPNLPYDAASYTGTVDGITGTWAIESRKQVREKTQLALDRGMPGMFTWTIDFDSSGNDGLHRVMHHYTMVKTDIPDVDLDGKVSYKDAFKLADNMGAMLTNTGMTSAAQFEAFYHLGNWEKGDHDGNGLVNQADAEWLVGRFNALGVTVPNRLPYSGTFDNFPASLGITGRWKAGRNAQNKLIETGNFKQERSNYLLWSSKGIGGRLHSNSFVTIRNQNTLEAASGLNALARTMTADITTDIDLGQNQDTYVKFLVRENTGSLSAAQLASSNRTLSLDFLNSSGASQFDIAFRGLQHQFAIDSVADTTGQDVSASGFSSDTTYMLIAKISGNGSGANTMFASLFATGATIGNFTDPSFQWMLTAQSSASFNPVITDIRFTTSAVANYTVSNVWIGSAATIMSSNGGAGGDSLENVPEPATFVLAAAALIMAFAVRRR